MHPGTTTIGEMWRIQQTGPTRLPFQQSRNVSGESPKSGVATAFWPPLAPCLPPGHRALHSGLCLSVVRPHFEELSPSLPSRVYDGAGRPEDLFISQSRRKIMAMLRLLSCFFCAGVFFNSLLPESCLLMCRRISRGSSLPVLLLT